MSRTTDSVLELASQNLDAARMVLPDHAHRFSPRKFTQPQLLAILAVRQQMNWPFRATSTRLDEWSDLRAVLGIEHAPHPATLCYAHRRLLDDKGGQRHPQRWRWQ